MSIITAIAFIVVFFASGLLFRMLLKGYRSRLWPTTEGVVTLSEIEVDMPGGDDAAYSAKIRYEYTVHRRLHIGTQIRALNWTRPYAEQVQELLQRYPVGAVVTVWYDPKRSEVAMLEPGVKLWEVAVFLAYLITLVVLGFGFIE